MDPQSIGHTQASDAAAAAAAAAAAMNAETNRRRLDELDIPTYQNINLPTSIGANTGFIPAGYVGGYGGLPTFGALSGSANEFGMVGGLDPTTGLPSADFKLDPRLAALGYQAGQKTLGGRTLDLQGDAQRAREYENNRDFNASRSDSDRLFGEAQRTAMQDQTNTDTKLALEMGVDPKLVVNGQMLPDYLQPHALWARQMAQGNGGKLPTYQDLVGQLGRLGETPESYNNGKPYAGTLPTVGPGIVNEPGRGYTDYSNGGKVITDPTELRGTIQNRMAQAPAISQDQNGQPVYSQQGSNQVVPAQQSAQGELGTGGRQMTQTMDNGNGVEGGGRMMNQTIAGGFVAPTPAGLSFGGSGATAAIGQGAPTSLDQRRLIEQGRATDIQAQLTQNGQAIQNKQVEYQNAVAQGNLELANRTQDELTALNNAKLDLEKQGQAFTQGIQAGGLTGSYVDANGNVVSTMDKQRLDEQARQFNTEQSGNLNGADTLAKGALLGSFNGLSTLEGQKAYGGSALVGGGLTLDAQNALGYVGGQSTLAREGQQANIGIQTADLIGKYAGPSSAFQQQAVLHGLNDQGLSNAVDAIAGRRAMPATQGYQAPVVGNSLQTMNGQLHAAGSGMVPPTFGGQAPSFGSTGAGQAFAQMHAGAAPPTFGAPQPAGGTDAYLQALPSLNQVAGQNYLRAPRATQQFLGSAYKQRGDISDQSELDEAARRNLNQFKAPTFGRMMPTAA